MIDLKKKYGFSKSLAKNGAKMEIGSDKEEYLLVRRIPNDDYREEITKVYQANAEKLEALEESDKDAYDDLQHKLKAEVAAKTVLVGWGKKVGFDGEPVKYSVEEAAKALYELEDLYTDVFTFGVSRENYPLENKVDVEHAKK